MRSLRNRLLSGVDYTWSVRRLHRLESKLLEEGKDLFNIPFTYRGFGRFNSMRPAQVTSEIRQLYETIAAAEPACVCEIGTHLGGTLYLWCKAAAKGAIIVSVDLPNSQELLEQVQQRRNFYAEFRRPSQQIYFVTADSHQRSTFDYLKNALGSECRLDFLFIDGDHSYEGARRDFEIYS